MNKLNLAILGILVRLLILAFVGLEVGGCSLQEESEPKLENSRMLVEALVEPDQEFSSYWLLFDFTNTLPKPIEIVSVNVFDRKCV